MGSRVVALIAGTALGLLGCRSSPGDTAQVTGAQSAVAAKLLGIAVTDHVVVAG